MGEALPAEVVEEIVARALAEDVGAGDITTEATIPEAARARAVILAKQEAVVAGLPLVAAVFQRLDPRVAVEPVSQDGGRVAPGDVVARLEGRARALLTGERTALNFLQHMSGVATLAARYAEAVEGTGARVLDTRKTIPGLRALDKYAVRMGGAHNHRMGLFDAVLIKDNHIRAAGGVSAAVERARAAAPEGAVVEVEAQNTAEVKEAVCSGADVILLDNMTPEEVKRAVALIAGRAKTEVSGGITLKTVRSYAECGVDYISVGEITHSARAVDFSLEFLERENG